MDHPDFTKEEWKILKASMERVSAEKGEILFEEGSDENALYYLEKGNLSVMKGGHLVAHLKSGNWVGEIAALQQGKKRSASVRAKEISVLWRVSMDDLKKATQKDPNIFIKVLSNLSASMASKLSSTTEAKVIAIQRQLDLAKIRIFMGQFFCYVLFALTAFFYATKIITLLQFQPKVTTASSIPLLLLLSSFLLIFIKKSGYPLATFGLTWKNWKRSTLESVLYTIPLGAFLVLIKWSLYSILPVYKDSPLFHFPALLQKQLGVTQWLLITVGYALFVPVQALLVNGCLQGPLARLFVGSNKTLLSIVLSNLIFSMLHLQLSLEMAIGSFFVGCFWGFLYARHHTLVGISISHIIVGIFIGIFLGYK